MQGDLPVMLVVICVQWKILICTARLNSAVPNDVASLSKSKGILCWGGVKGISAFQRVLNVTSKLKHSEK